jgi:hypothetical protein
MIPTSYHFLFASSQFLSLLVFFSRFILETGQLNDLLAWETAQPMLVEKS